MIRSSSRAARLASALMNGSRRHEQNTDPPPILHHYAALDAGAAQGFPVHGDVAEVVQQHGYLPIRVTQQERPQQRRLAASEKAGEDDQFLAHSVNPALWGRAEARASLFAPFGENSVSCPFSVR